MIKEKLQQVGHDMGSLVEKQHIYHGHYQTLGVRISASYFDCHFPSCDVGFWPYCYQRSLHKHEWQLSACTSLGQTWEATHIAGEIYAIEPFAYDHDKAEAQSYLLS